MQKGNILIFLLIGFVAVGAIVGAFYFGKQFGTKSQQPSSQSSQNTPLPAPDETTGWKTYTNTKYGLSFKYPADWTPNGPNDPKDNSFGITSPEAIEYHKTHPENLGVAGGYMIQFYIYSKDIADSSTTLNSNKNVANSNSITVGGITTNYQVISDPQNPNGFPIEEVKLRLKTEDLLTFTLDPIFQKGEISDKDLKSHQDLFKKLLSTFEFTAQSQTSQTSDSCLSEKGKILMVVTNFETLQKNKDPNILNLFTPAQTSSEINDYNNLSGKDNNIGPRLYNNVSTNFNTNSYQVIQNPANYSDISCSIIVQENRSYYGGPSNPQYLPSNPSGFTLILIKQQTNWKIDKYQNQNGKNSGQSDKYTGWLF